MNGQEAPTEADSAPARYTIRVTRRGFLWLSAAASAARPAAKPDAYPGVSYRQYSRCLPGYLRTLALQAYQRRNRALAELKSPEDVRRRQQWARETFWKLIGGLPERTPLNARVLGGFERPGYRVEKVVYESRPGFHISANLYIPTEARAPLPGVLFQMGHSLNGKAADAYQRCCQGLVRLGYVVLAFDPMGQGERVYYPDATGMRTRLGSADDEHTVPGRQMLLLGDTATRLQVWDAIRSLDYLASHPLVDSKRLASTGQSGGGTLTMFLACADERLAAAAVASGNTENFACADFHPPGSTDDAEQNFLFSAPAGFDRWDLLYPLAPKPLLISASDKDFFGTYSPSYISSGWEEFRKLRRIYEILGHAEQLAWTSTPLPHGLSYDTRLKIYNWFNRWLKGQRQPIEQEPPTAPEPEKALWVSESGSVVKSFASLTPFELNRRNLPARSPRRPSAETLTRLLALERPDSAVRFRILARVPGNGLRIEAAETTSAAGVWLPAWLFLPDGDEGSKPVLLLLDPAGRNARWREGELCQQLAAAGWPVCAADLRGIGDLTPEFAGGAAHYARSHNDEENYAWASLILGRPLVGQRVTDILALAAALSAHPALGGRAIHLAARGALTVPALFAAALETRIAHLYLAGGLVSLRSLVETENYAHPFGNFLFGVLREFDLPDLAAMMAPRRVTLAGAVNAAGRRLEESEVRAEWGQENVEIQREASWDVRGLTAGGGLLGGIP